MCGPEISNISSWVAPMCLCAMCGPSVGLLFAGLNKREDRGHPSMLDSERRPHARPSLCQTKSHRADLESTSRCDRPKRSLEMRVERLSQSFLPCVSTGWQQSIEAYLPTRWPAQSVCSVGLLFAGLNRIVNRKWTRKYYASKSKSSFRSSLASG